MGRSAGARPREVGRRHSEGRHACGRRPVAGNLSGDLSLSNSAVFPALQPYAATSVLLTDGDGRATATDIGSVEEPLDSRSNQLTNPPPSGFCRPSPPVDAPCSSSGPPPHLPSILGPFPSVAPYPLLGPLASLPDAGVESCLRGPSYSGPTRSTTPPLLRPLKMVLSEPSAPTPGPPDPLPPLSGPSALLPGPLEHESEPAPPSATGPEPRSPCSHLVPSPSPLVTLEARPALALLPSEPEPLRCPSAPMHDGPVERSPVSVSVLPGSRLTILLRRSPRLAAKYRGTKKSSLRRAQDLMCKKLKLTRFASKVPHPLSGPLPAPSTATTSSPPQADGIDSSSSSRSQAEGTRTAPSP